MPWFLGMLKTNMVYFICFLTFQGAKENAGNNVNANAKSYICLGSLEFVDYIKISYLYLTTQGAKASVVHFSGIDIIAIGHQNNSNATERSSTFGPLSMLKTNTAYLICYLTSQGAKANTGNNVNAHVRSYTCLGSVGKLMTKLRDPICI